MRTLLIDIETTPNLAHVWELWNVNVSLSQLQVPTEMMCFAAKWQGYDGIYFYSGHADGKPVMVEAAHQLLDQADTVIHYNGKRFDIPHLNREFVQAGFTPPAPYKQIDLCEVVKKVFKFPSNKLAYVLPALGIDGKVSHSGHELWVKCLAGDPEAWKTMRIYNERDVTALEDLYEVLQPWIPGHPSHGAFDGGDVCPACGGSRLERQGYALTAVSKYQRYRCKDCGKWSRGTRREGATGITEVAA